MSPEARALAQVLLAHHKRLRRGWAADSKVLESHLLTYADLCKQAGFQHLKPTVGKYLREIAGWCHKNGWPPLNALAVNYKTLRPGRGYGDAPGCNSNDWRDQVTDCIGFKGYPENVDE